MFALVVEPANSKDLLMLLRCFEMSDRIAIGRECRRQASAEHVAPGRRTNALQAFARFDFDKLRRGFAGGDGDNSFVRGNKDASGFSPKPPACASESGDGSARKRLPIALLAVDGMPGQRGKGSREQRSFQKSSPGQLPHHWHSPGLARVRKALELL